MQLLNFCAFPNELNTIGNNDFKLPDFITYVIQNDLTIGLKLVRFNSNIQLSSQHV